MRKYIFLIFGLLYITASQAQLPKLNLKKQNLVFPAFMPGLMKDSSATLVGDSFIYQLPSQWFLDNPVKLGDNGAKNDLSSPYITVNEMAIAYASKNSTRIKELYNSSSKDAISSLLDGKDGATLLQYFAGAKNVVLLGAISYRNGYMVYTKDDVYGVHENYIVEEKGKFYLSQLDDKSSGVSWNLGVYFKNNPQPLEPVRNVAFPDSLSYSDSFEISVSVKSGYWVELYYPPLRQLIPYRIEDNGTLDFDRSPGKVKFYLMGKNFPGGRGNYTFYMAATNYCVMLVAPSMVNYGTKYQIKIY